MTTLKSILTLGVALSLTACAGNGQLTTAAQADIANAKANVCPSLAAVETTVAASNLKLTNNQQLVVSNLNAFCNDPAPVTSVAQLAAYGTSVALLAAQIAQEKK